MSARSASQLLWSILGAPQRDDCEATDGLPCWLCGHRWDRGQPVEQWSGASFTGQNRVRHPVGTHVCEPCVQVCSRVAPVPGRPPKPGKKFGGNFRNYSHLYDAGDYANASKGEKPAILAFLQGDKSGPWFAAIADSGQKHVLPWAPVNPGGGRGGRVLFDEQLVTVGDLGLIEDMAAFLTAGATKEEIGLGEYRPQTWLRCRDAVHTFEREWAHARGGGWWSLSLWLAQRDEDAVADRLEDEAEASREKKEKKRGTTQRRAARKAADNDSRADPNDAGDVPRRVRRKRRAQALGAPPDEVQERSSKGGEPRRVGDDDAQRASAAEPKQLGIPGFG